MAQDPFPRRIPRLFWKCLALSTGVHLLFLVLVYQHPLWVATWLSPFGHPKPQQGTVYHPPNDFFDGVFEKLLVVTPSKKVGFDSPHQSNLEQQLPTLENPSFRREKFNAPFVPSISVDVVTEGLLLREPSRSIPLAEAFFANPNPVVAAEEVFFRSEPKLPELAVATSKEEQYPEEKKKAFEEPLENTPISFSEQPISSSEELAQAYSPQSLDFVKKPKEMRPLPHFAASAIASKQDQVLFIQAYGLPNWDKRQNWNHFFTADIRVMPRKEQEGLYFAITLTPKPEAYHKTMGQQIHFVIDGSRDVEKHRISLYKRAIVRALSYLTEGQSFNIYFVDNHVHALASSPLSVSKKTLQEAREFLEKDRSSAKGIDVAQNLLSLFQAIDQKACKDEFNQELVSVVLLSDGGFLKNKSTGLSSFKNWLKEGAPSFVLYPATVGNDSHPPLFDLLASASGGKVLHSPTHAAFPRKFSKLLLDLQMPVATKVFPQLEGIDSGTAISLIGTCCKLAPLYASHPITLFGVADSPGAFRLNLDGWHKEFPMEISLDIDLKTCREGTMTMRQIILQDKAEHELSLFLKNGKGTHFEQALDWIEDALQPTR